MEIDLEAIEFIQSNIMSVILVGALSLMRPLGLTLSFICIAWALPQANIIRTGIAFALAIPVMWNEWVSMLALIAPQEWFTLSTYFVKEILIGYIIGILLSIPFWIVQFSGSLIDAYRGEVNSGFSDPIGGEISTIGRLYLVSAFLIFVTGGGMLFLVEILYSSYQIWPVAKHMPQLSTDTPAIVLGIFDSIFVMALVIAAPILFVMIAIDFVVIFSGKIAKGFSALDISFSAKNLLMIITLPAMVIILTQYVEQNLFQNIEVMTLIQRIVP